MRILLNKLPRMLTIELNLSVFITNDIVIVKWSLTY